MREVKERDKTSFREIAVLSIVPLVVAVLIAASWVIAGWGTGAYYASAGLAIIATLFGGFQRFIAGFMGNVLHRENIYRPVLAKQFRPTAISFRLCFPDTHLARSDIRT